AWDGPWLALSCWHGARLLDPETRHATVQIGAVGGEPARGLGHVAVRRRQRPRDERALVLVQCVRERDVGPLSRPLPPGRGPDPVPREHPGDVLRRDGGTRPAGRPPPR